MEEMEGERKKSLWRGGYTHNLSRPRQDDLKFKASLDYDIIS